MNKFECLIAILEELKTNTGHERFGICQNAINIYYSLLREGEAPLMTVISEFQEAFTALGLHEGYPIGRNGFVKKDEEGFEAMDYYRYCEDKMVWRQGELRMQLIDMLIAHFKQKLEII